MTSHAPTAPEPVPYRDGRRLLVVDDDDVLLRLLTRQLAALNYDVVACNSAARALEAMREAPFDAAILDYALDGTTGLDLMRDLQQIEPYLVIVMLSGTIEVPQAVEAIKAGAEDVLLKPPSLALLNARLEAGLARTTEVRAQRLIAAQLDDPCGLFDPGIRMRRVRQQLERAAGQDFPLLIVGEPGTGRRELAALAHRLSPQRSGQQFLIEMGNTSAAELDEQLRRYHRIDASRTNPAAGPLPARHSLLLHEMGVLASSTQGELRALLEWPAPVRVITTTHRDLAADAAVGRLSPSVYQRLGVRALYLPPLRDRGDTAVMSLATQLLARQRADADGGPLEIDTTALEWIASRPWHGNVPELRRVIAAAFVLAGDDEIITVRHLESARVTSPESTRVNHAEDDWTLRSAERRQIVAVLELTGHNRSKAARLLGVTRTTLYKKLEEYGISSVSK